MNLTESGQLYGYAGSLLRIDLSKGKVSVEKTDPEILRKFLGGVGYGAKTILRRGSTRYQSLRF